MDDPSPTPAKRSFSEELQEFRAQKAKNVASSKTSVPTTIKREMTLYEATGNRGHCLERIRSALKTIAPTSVEAERAFRKDLHLGLWHRSI